MGYANSFNVAPVGRAGVQSLWWDDSMKVEIIEVTQNYIDAKCSLVDAQCVFRFAGIYGTSYRAENAGFWRGMTQKFRPDTIIWVCSGDYNEFLWEHKKLGGA